MGLRAGIACDLTNGCDFRIAAQREKALQYVREEKPWLVIGSPMCTMCSVLQNLSPWTSEKQRKWCEAVEHMQFICDI